jgi:hypothetical protein
MAENPCNNNKEMFPVAWWEGKTRLDVKSLNVHRQVVMNLNKVSKKLHLLALRADPYIYQAHKTPQI